MNGGGLAWLAAQPLPACAREQVSAALAMIDALDAPDRAARSGATRLRTPPARMQGAARPLRDRPDHRGHDPRRTRRPQPLLFLPRSGPLRRAGHHRAPIRPAPRPRTPLPPRTTSAALGAVRSRAVRPAAQLARPRLLPRSRGSGSAATAPASRSRANCSSAATTRCASSARRRSSPHDHQLVRAALTHTDAPRPAPGTLLPPRQRGRPS